MNTYIALCLMAVLGLTQGSPLGGYGYGLGYGSHWHYPAVSSVNVYRSPSVYKPVGWYGYGWASPGWNTYGWSDYGKWGGYGGWRGAHGWGWSDHH